MRGGFTGAGVAAGERPAGLAAAADDQVGVAAVAPYDVKDRAWDLARTGGPLGRGGPGQGAAGGVRRVVLEEVVGPVLLLGAAGLLGFLIFFPEGAVVLFVPHALLCALPIVGEEDLVALQGPVAGEGLENGAALVILHGAGHADHGGNGQGKRNGQLAKGLLFHRVSFLRRYAPTFRRRAIKSIGLE